MCTVIKSIKRLNNTEPTVLGELLALVCIPFYGAFWAFSRGKQMAIGAKSKGVQLGDSSVVYVFFSAVGLTLITLCLMQNELNTVAKQLAA